MPMWRCLGGLHGLLLLLGRTPNPAQLVVAMVGGSCSSTKANTPLCLSNVSGWTDESL